MPAPPLTFPPPSPSQPRRENLRILFCSVLQKGLSATELREFFFLSLFQKTGQEKHNACCWRHLILSSYFFSLDGFFICMCRTFYYGDSGTRKSTFCTSSPSDNYYLISGKCVLAPPLRCCQFIGFWDAWDSNPESCRGSRGTNSKGSVNVALKTYGPKVPYCNYLKDH